MLLLKLVNVETGELLEVDEKNYKTIKEMDSCYEYGYVIRELSCKDFNLDLQIDFLGYNERIFPLAKIETIFSGFLKAKAYTVTRNYFLAEMKKHRFREEPSPMKFYNLTANMIA